MERKIGHRTVPCTTKPVQLPGIVQKLIGGNEIPSTGQLITNIGSTAAGSVTGTLLASSKNIEKKVTGFADKFNMVTPVPDGSILTTKPYKTLGEGADVASKGLAGTSFLLDAANTWTADSGNTNLQRIEKTGIQFTGAVISYGVGQLSARMAAAGLVSSETGVGALLIPAAVVVDGAAAYGIDKGQNYLYNKLGIK